MSDDTNEATGRAKGGYARAAKLTKEQRSEIARKGAMARKARVLTDEAVDQDPIEHEGVVKLGDFTAPCFVTKSGVRLIASRKMQEILKVVEEDPEDQPGVQRPGTRFQRFLTRKFFNSLIPKEELQDLFTPFLALRLGNCWCRTSTRSPRHRLRWTPSAPPSCMPIWSASPPG